MAGLKHMHEEERVRRHGHRSRWEYQKDLLRRNGYTVSDNMKPDRVYLDGLVSALGYDSIQKYNCYRASVRRGMLKNMVLSYLIEQKLKESGHGSKWLADQVGVSARTIKRYKRGEFLPKAQLAEKLFSALGVPYRTIEDIVSIEPKSL